MFRSRKVRKNLPKVIQKAKSRAELEAERLLNDALKQLEPQVADAFKQAALYILLTPALLARLAAAIETGNMVEAERLVGIERLAGALRGEGLNPNLVPFSEKLRAAMAAGGKAGQIQMGPALARASASLDLTNPAAITYLSETVPSLIAEITEESRLAVQDTLLRGFQQGRPAREMAKEIRNTVGLTRLQGQWVSNFREQLETGQIIGVRAGRRRLNAADRALAEAMRRAALDGNPYKAAQIDEMVDRYHRSLLNRRARNIARTETTKAFGEGQRSLWSQAAQRGLLVPEKTRRRWLVTPDDRLRESHAAVPGMNPNGVALDEPYQTPVGPVMGPRTSGIAAFDVNCRCTEYLEFLP